MKRFIHVLKEEHRLIERAAACLDRIADGAVAREGLDAVAALEVLEFLEHFANEGHQWKEERVLFPALLSQGLQCPRVGELLLEHRCERETLETLHAGLEGAAYGDPLSCDRFAQLAHEYALAQIAHTSKEEQELLPIAAERLDPSCEQELLAGLRAIDAHLGLQSLGHYDRALERVARRVGAMAPVRPRPRLSARIDSPAREEFLLLEELCSLDRDVGDESIVLYVAGGLVRERSEDLALEPSAG